MKIITDDRPWFVIVILCGIIIKKFVDSKNQLQVWILSRFVDIYINTVAQDSLFINIYNSNIMM